MESHKAKVEWKEAMQFEAEVAGGKVALDAKEDFGGQGKGLRSKQLMLAGLGGCTGMDLKALLAKMRVNFDAMWIDIEGELTEEHPKYYHHVHIDYHFKGNNLDREKIEKAIQLSFDKYCGVIAMFKKFAKVDFEIHYHSA